MRIVRCVTYSSALESTSPSYIKMKTYLSLVATAASKSALLLSSVWADILNIMYRYLVSGVERNRREER